LPNAEYWLATADDRMIEERVALMAKAATGKGIAAPTTVAHTDSNRSLLDALQASLEAVGA
jgi:hypothetical protein